jgi:hypothetical protein
MGAISPIASRETIRTAGTCCLLNLTVLLVIACGSAGHAPYGDGSSEPAHMGDGDDSGDSEDSGASTRDDSGSGGQDMEDAGHGDGAEPGDAGRADDDAGTDTDAGELVVPPDVEPELACTRTVDVANSNALENALAGVQAGDCIVLADGSYTFPTISAQASEQKPIIIRAKNTLKARVEGGDITLKNAKNVVVQGIHFTSSGRITLADSDHCRISRFRMERKETDQEIDWITLGGSTQYGRIDHSEFGPQNHIGNMIMLAGKGSQVVQYTRIDHNYFHDVNYSSGNGWELIRAGLSGLSMSSGHATIEHNLFVHADSDPETISVKSSDNIIRYNTLRATAGQFTLRHGNRNQVYGNYIFGDDRAGSAGLRIYGGNHKIYDNYIENVAGLAINVDGGENDDEHGALTDHKVCYGVSVVYNTIVSKQGIGVGSGKPLQPRDTVVANNIVQGAGLLISEHSGSTNTKLKNNLVHGGQAGVSTGVINKDPKLVQKDGAYRIASGSPATDAADDSYGYVGEDIQGKARKQPDIGADELGSGAVKRRGPLTPADVGPASP